MERQTLRQKPQRVRGTTVLELLLASALAVVLLLGAGGLVVALSRAYRIEAEEARLLQRAQAALTRISRDVRAAGLGGLLLPELVAPAPCLAGPLPLFQATNTPPVLTIRRLLDDPAAVTHLSPPPPAGQSQTSAVLRVDATAGFTVGDRALITDRTQWSLFTVSAWSCPPEVACGNGKASPRGRGGGGLTRTPGPPFPGAGEVPGAGNRPP